MSYIGYLLNKYYLTETCIIKNIVNIFSNHLFLCTGIFTGLIYSVSCGFRNHNAESFFYLRRI